MSKFYGTLQGKAKTVATRCGTRNSGITARAASWAGAIEVYVFERDGKECFEVKQIPWHGRGIVRDIASGTMGE